MSAEGYRKVSRKARRGRRRKSPEPHRGHRSAHAVNDPITRAMKRVNRQVRERATAPRNPADRQESA